MMVFCVSSFEQKEVHDIEGNRPMSQFCGVLCWRSSCLSFRRKILFWSAKRQIDESTCLIYLNSMQFSSEYLFTFGRLIGYIISISVQSFLKSFALQICFSSSFLALMHSSMTSTSGGGIARIVTSNSTDSTDSTCQIVLETPKTVVRQEGFD